MASLRHVRVGSRKSQLALVQTNMVVDSLKAFHSATTFEIVTMTTVGDRTLDVPLSKIGEKSLFTKELEVALAAGQVDLVVHSLKDLPTTLPEGVAIGAICQREDPSDAVVIRTDLHDETGSCSLELLPAGSVVGTSSVRRIAQLKRTYPHLKFENIRGNVDTRLRKLDDANGHYDAIILATAGIKRMGLEHRISQRLSSSDSMHAIGQGALAVEVRAGDVATLQLVSCLNDSDTVLCCVGERAFLRALEGGCSVPIAVRSKVFNNKIILTGGVYSLDGSDCLIAKHSIIDTEPGDHLVNIVHETELHENNSIEDLPIICGIQVIAGIDIKMVRNAETTGIELADILVERGAKKILDNARLQNDNTDRP